jgi:hypothetical protein
MIAQITLFEVSKSGLKETILAKSSEIAPFLKNTFSEQPLMQKIPLANNDSKSKRLPPRHRNN